MAKFWQTAEFKALEAQWYETLRHDGFVDAEEEVGGEPSLSQNASNAYRKACPIDRQAKIGYYQLLRRCLEVDRPENPIEQLIMIRKSEGVLIKDILKELKSMGIKRHRQTIGYVIRRLENKWQIRTWTKSQMKVTR